MHKAFKLFLIAILLFTGVTAQELNCTIDINYDQVRGSNRQVFETMQTALTDFINKRKWTNKVYKLQERIDCGMTFIISERDGNNFTATLQVNAVRPVFGSSYKSPIFNFRDTNASFEYVEFQPLNFNPTLYESNLVSLISFYVYMILGVDADTFALKGGEPFYQQALEVVNLAQQSGISGWESKRNQLNRYSLVDQILAPGHREYREAMYAYHIKGLDRFSQRDKDVKETIMNSVISFDRLFIRNQNSFVIRVFFDAKADEIVNIFSDGPNVDKRSLLNTLSRVSAGNSSKWEKIQ